MVTNMVKLQLKRIKQLCYLGTCEICSCLNGDNLRAQSKERTSTTKTYTTYACLLMLQTWLCENKDPMWNSSTGK